MPRSRSNRAASTSSLDLPSPAPAVMATTCPSTVGGRGDVPVEYGQLVIPTDHRQRVPPVAGRGGLPIRGLKAYASTANASPLSRWSLSRVERRLPPAAPLTQSARTWPGGAAAISRAARFTASPKQQKVRRIAWP